MLHTRPIIRIYKPGAVEIVPYFARIPGYWNDPTEVRFVSHSFPALLVREEKLRSDDDGKNHRMKPCEHYCFTWDNSVLGQACSVSTDQWGNYPNWSNGTPQNMLFGLYDGSNSPLFDPRQGLTAYVDTDKDEGFVSHPSNIDQLIQSAYQRMMPEIKAELSLINTLIELKDFASLPRTLRNLAALGNIALRGGTLREVIAQSKLIVRNTAGSVSDAFLQWKFNIGTLISDINGLIRGLSSVLGRLNRLIHEQGGVRTRHFVYTWREEQVQTVQTNWWSYDPAYWEVRYQDAFAVERQVLPEATVFHATMKYNYNFMDYQVEHARLLALLDVVGVNFNPQIIWNALPWSFVVDWVFGVNRWLSQTKISNMKPVINIHDCCYSTKRVRRVVLTKKIRKSNYPAPLSVVQLSLPIAQESTYRRNTGLPSSSSIISSGVNANEFTLGAALVLSRGRRRR